jgi:gliding motility-associated-like protein
VTCTHPAVQVNADADCVATATWTPPVFADNCSVTVTSTHAPGATFPLGSTQVTYTGKDPSNNIRTCSFLVVVHDVTVPVLSGCPTGPVFGSATTSCGVAVSWTEPTATDNCDDFSNLDIFSNYPPGYFFPVGTTSVTYTAIDENDNFSTCSFDVTVTDDAAPVISNCPSNINVFADGDCLTPVSWTEPTATDNCSALPFTKTHTPGVSLFGLGTTTVTYTVKDPSNNTSTCSFTVTVVDNTPPVLTNCPTDMIVPAAGNCQAIVTFTPPNVNDNCGATLTVSKASGTSFVLGETVVTYTAKDAALNSSTCSFKVIVVDATAPVFSNCPANITVDAATNCEKAVGWTAPTVTDNCSATVTTTHTIGSTFPLGETTVTYEAEDAAGNTAMCSFTVTVVDNVAPVFTNCPGNIALSATSSCGSIGTWGPLNVSDDCDVTITSSHNSGDVFPVGTTTVEIEAEDESGNISTCTFDVVVEDDTAPVIVCLADITVSANASCEAVVTWHDPAYTDNCSATLSSDVASGSAFELGSTPVTITATDPSGNTSTCTFNVVVVDDTSPVIQNCVTDITVSANDDCQAMVTWTPPTAGDNCSVIMTSTHTPGTLFGLGVTTVTYTAEDGAGNKMTCSFDINVTDTSAPVISNCPTDITVNVESNCEAIVNWTAPTADDNCSVALTSSHTPGAAFAAGTTTITYTATDPAGNTSTCSFNVIVVDSDAPVLANCPSDIQLTVNAHCQAIATWTAPTATDGCTLTLTSTHNSGDAFPTGTTAVTYTATDNSGNASTCSFNVIVTDASAPVFSNCPSDITLNGDTNCQANAVWSAPSVVDDCMFTVTSTRLSGSSFPVGVTTVIFTAVDASGNTSTCSFTVTVQDVHAPIITACPSMITLNAGSDCQTSASWTPPQFADCSTFQVTSSHSPGTSFALGTTIVTYTVTDEQGLSSSCTFDVIVEDKTGPVFTNCPQDITIAVGGNCDAVVSWTVPGANDNCSTVAMTKTHDPGQTFQLGATPVRYSATDASGNITTCEFMVNVVNEHLPVITGCPDDISLKADESGLATTEWIEPTATVECTEVSITSPNHPGETFPVGTTQVIYTATSGAGKISTCSFKVVVEYEELSFDVNQLVTPDGDGINDQWTIPNLEKFKDNKVMIVDRWGSVVYQSTGYNNENVVWKGMSQGGLAAPTGTYYYTISVRFLSEVREKKGFIELIR